MFPDLLRVMMLLSNTSGVVSRFVVLHKHHCSGYWISTRTLNKQPVGRRHQAPGGKGRGGGERWQMIDRKLRSGWKCCPSPTNWTWGAGELTQVKTNCPLSHCHMQSDCSSQPLRLFSSKLPLNNYIFSPHWEIIIRDLRLTVSSGYLFPFQFVIKISI